MLNIKRHDPGMMVSHADNERVEHIQIILTSAQEAYNEIPDQLW